MWFGGCDATLVLSTKSGESEYGGSVGVIRQVASASEFDRPAMSWEGIDHALNRVRGEAARVALDLAELDRHGAYRLIQGADLTGETRRRWEPEIARVQRLWKSHEAFSAVVERAAHVRGAGGEDPRAELDLLLTGASVALPTGENVAPAEAVARMTGDYEAVTETVSAIETAWDVLQPRLGELEAMWKEVCTLSDMVELPADAHEGLRENLERIGETVHGDPLALVVDDGVDTSALLLLRDALDRTRGELRDALRMRDSYEESVRRLTWAIDDVEQAALRTERLRARVVEKISSPEASERLDPVPGLRAAVAEMDELRDRGDWRELGSRLGRIQQTVHDVEDALREQGRVLTELLQRRAELRGRLDSCRARAARLGLDGHRRLVAPYVRAHWELWSAPSDLRAATTALTVYDRTLRELANGRDPDGEAGDRDGASG